MKIVFIILGYGIPKDITKDENYNIYLRTVFNIIFYEVTSGKNISPQLIFCGGKTDMFKPYNRTEAAEMIRFFKILSDRPSVKKFTSQWIFQAEKKSISTLENLLFSHELIKRKFKNVNKVFIFCEKTREKRIKYSAKKIFNKDLAIKVISIDFDNRPNRYLDPKLLEQKEKKAIKMTDLILKTPDHLKKHRQDFIEKFNLMRNTKSEKRAEVLRQWWKKHIT